MDKQTTIGFVLIALVLIIWMYWQTPTQPVRHQGQDSVHVLMDTVKAKEPAPAPVQAPVKHVEVSPDSLGKFFSASASGENKTLLIKTDLYTAEVTTRGGLIRKWDLTKYKTWSNYPVPLVDFDKGGNFSLLFTSTDGKLINTRNLYFAGNFTNWKTIELHGDESFTADLVLTVGGNRRIVKRYTFTNGKYSFDADIRFENMQDVIGNYEYQITWDNAVPYAEENSVNESGHAAAYAFSGGELTEVNAGHPDEPEIRDFNGATSWVAARNKYFAVALLPTGEKSQGVYIKGVDMPQPDKGSREIYSLALKMPFSGSSMEESRTTVFLGPLEYDLVTSYQKSLDKIMSLGAAWIIRPIAEYVMLPLFTFLKSFIPNFGLVIIIFSLIIKIALTPLSRTSMTSMKKMQALQPMMQEIRDKYKDEPQKMNQHMMSLYKDYGVNPASGCLPLLLQLPILYALWNIFSSSIELRQASFIWWIKDLSTPDILIHLPFSLPIIGTSNLSGLALAMGITMFIQQKMTVTDPRQKAMVWMMPVMMTLLFNSLPSGVNLYYFVFNLLSIVQQTYVNKKHQAEPLKKIDPKNRKVGFLERLTRDLEKARSK